MYAEKLKNAKPNLSVLKEYRKREEEFLKRAKDLEEITNLRDEQKQRYDGLRKQRLDEFMAGFSLISMKLKEMYQVRCEFYEWYDCSNIAWCHALQMITLGGNAELELVDSMDPFSEGIIFSVMPPKKSWKNISNLSGGEKVSHCKSPVRITCNDILMVDTEFSRLGVCPSRLQGKISRNDTHYSF